MGGETAFADDEEHFILDVIRQGYATYASGNHMLSKNHSNLRITGCCEIALICCLIGTPLSRKNANCAAI